MGLPCKTSPIFHCAIKIFLLLPAHLYGSLNKSMGVIHCPENIFKPYHSHFTHFSLVIYKCQRQESQKMTYSLLNIDLDHSYVWVPQFKFENFFLFKFSIPVLVYVFQFRFIKFYFMQCLNKTVHLC